MTEPAKGHAELVERDWLIRKRGYFYRPNFEGYTVSALEAGRYTKKEADAEAANEPANIKAIHISEVSTPIAAHGAGPVTEAMVKAYRAKYREIWPGGHPDTETTRELLDAAFAALRPDEAAGQGEAVKAYLAENAERGWTGRAFGFDGGGLNVDRKGNAEFVFDMNDLEPYYEEGKNLMLAKVPASEIEALRDYFVAAFPATPRPEASDAPDIVETADMVDKAVAWDLIAEKSAPIAALRAELAAVMRERDEALSEVEGLRSQAETVAEEFEKDCWKAIKSLLTECNFEWRDVEPDGVSAEDAREYISTTLDEMEKGEQRWKSRAEAAEAEVARLKDALTPSAETKAAYIGEFSFPLPYWDTTKQEEATRQVDVPWTTIKAIMAAIRARSLTATKGG